LNPRSHDPTVDGARVASSSLLVARRAAARVIDAVPAGRHGADHVSALVPLFAPWRCKVNRRSTAPASPTRCGERTLSTMCRCFNTLVTEERHIAEVGAVALYGLIEELVRSGPGQPDGPAASGAGVASRHDALTAVAELARVIEEPAQAGDLDPEYAYRMASLLLVVRDFVEPVGPGADEHLSRYLTEVVSKLRDK